MVQKSFGLALCVGLCLSLGTAQAYAARPDLTAAKDALAAGDYAQVLALVEPLVASDGANGETFYLQGEAQRALGRVSEAETSYRKAIDDKYKEPEVYVGLAYALIDLDRAAEVPDLVEKPLSKAKDVKQQAMLKHALGKAELALGNFSKAQEWLLGARYDDLESLEYRADLGHAYYEGQILPLAIAEYEAVLEADSSRLGILYRLAETYYQQRRLNEARPLLTNLITKDSTYHSAYFMLANIYMIGAESLPLAQAREYYGLALSLYRRVRMVDPDADPILVAKNIAKVYYLLNAHDSAIVELQNAIRTGADDPELQFFLGRSNMLLGNYAGAVSAFNAYRTALENAQPPHRWVAADAELFWRTAVCLEATKDSTLMPQVAANYERAVELDPNDERSIGGLALALHRLGRYLEAAVEFEKLVVRYPDDSRTLFNASLPYLQTENNEKAVEYLLRAATNDTTAESRYRARAYKLSGPRLIKMQRNADAKMAYRWLVENEPDVCDHYQWYGFTLFAEKNYAGAVPHLRRAYQCNEQRTPGGCGHNELRWWLAYALYETDDKDESYELCEKVVDCSPDNMDARNLINRIDEEIVE
ncbi:MAG TPA: tetratricopeptide repeat protein [Acidobacteriota bacterium]|nr:tetratricopeptide repeat protein [Acidobacteriota bacterium]